MDAPLESYRVLSSVIHLTCLSALAYVFAGRCRLSLLLAILRGKPATWTRICSIIVFTLSWIFAFSASVLVLGVGISSTAMACSSGIIICVIVYAVTKVFIYCFLVDKVYVVWTAGADPGRLQSRLWKICMLGVVCYFAVFITAFVMKQSIINPTGQCEIGLKRHATIPLLTYDLFLTGLLTCLFVYPLRTSTMNPRLRKTATKALIAALASLTSSAANVAILVAMPYEPGWVCMACCVADVTINALALFYVTSGPEAPSPLLSVVSQKKRLRRSENDSASGVRTIGLSTVGELLPDMSLEEKDEMETYEEDGREVDMEKQELCVCGRPIITAPLTLVPTPPAASAAHLPSPTSRVQITRQESFTILRPSTATPTSGSAGPLPPSPTTRRKQGWSSWGGSGDVSITLAIPVTDPRSAQPPGLVQQQPPISSPISASDSIVVTHGQHSSSLHTLSATSMIPSSLHIPSSAVISSTTTTATPQHHQSSTPLVPPLSTHPSHPILRRFSSSPPRMRIADGGKRVSREHPRRTSMEKRRQGSPSPGPYECECGCGLVGESSTTPQLSIPAPASTVKPNRSFTSLSHHHPPTSFSSPSSVTAAAPYGLTSSISASPLSISPGRKSSDPVSTRTMLSRTSPNTPSRRDRRPSTAPQSPSSDATMSPMTMFSDEWSDQAHVRPKSSIGRLGQQQLQQGSGSSNPNGSNSGGVGGGGSIGPDRTPTRRPSLRRLSSKPSFMRLRGMMDMLRPNGITREGKNRVVVPERGRTLETALVFDDDEGSSVALTGGERRSGSVNGKGTLPRRATTVPLSADEDRHSFTSSSAGGNHNHLVVPAPTLTTTTSSSLPLSNNHTPSPTEDTHSHDRDHHDGASIPTRTRTHTADSSTPLIMDEPRELLFDVGQLRRGSGGSSGVERDRSSGRLSQSGTVRNTSTEGRRSVTH